MAAEFKSTHKLTCHKSELNAGLIKQFLDPIDDDACVKITVQPPDRPGEISMVTLSAEVDILRGRIIY